MNVYSVINQLQKKYPGKNIVFNDEDNVTEIICEIEPTSEHPDYNVAIAVIDASKAHYHKKSKETYKVLKGKLMIYLDGKEFMLTPGESIEIKPKVKHYATGNETWLKVYSNPGWTIDDHFLINE